MAVALLFDSLEGLEKFAQIFILDTYSGVGNFKSELGIAARRTVVPDTQRDTSALRILNGVGKQVHHDLRDPHVITVELRRDRLIDLNYELQPLKARTLADRIYEIIYKFCNIEFDRDQSHLAVFDLREIKDVVYDRQKRISGALDVGRIFQDLVVL